MAGGLGMSIVFPKKKIPFSVSLLCLTVILNLNAQIIPDLEKGDPNFRRHANLDANDLRVTIHNCGVFGWEGSSPGQYGFEWPKKSKRQHIHFISPWIGGEVVDMNGDSIRIVSVAIGRTGPVGQPWNFQPVPGYMNPDNPYKVLARSDDPGSWPRAIDGGWLDKRDDPDDPGWIGSWNGFWGKNIFKAELETYTHMSDDLYDRYDYYSDSTDSSRRGLGVIVSQRAFQMEGLPDEAFFLYDIFNAGTEDINRASLALWIADLLGGDSQDDCTSVDLDNDVIYCMDRDGIGTEYWAGDTVGVAAVIFLQTPYCNFSENTNQTGLTSVVQLPAFSINFQTVSDTELWQKVMTPGVFNVQNRTGEYDVHASVGYFPLPRGEFQRCMIAVSMGENRKAIERKLEHIRYAYQIYFAGKQKLPAQIIFPEGESIHSGEVQIEWQIENQPDDLIVGLFFSDDFGNSWETIAADLENTGSYLWNTNIVNDGVLNQLKMIAYNENYYAEAVTDSVFTINNIKKARPQIMITSPVENTTYNGVVPIKWIGGDADGDQVDIHIYLEIPEAEVSYTVESGLNNTGIFHWNTDEFPNSTNYNLYAKISHGRDAAIDVIKEIGIDNPHPPLTGSEKIQRSTIGTGIIEARIVDTEAITDHNYGVHFIVDENGQTSYDVIDESLNKTMHSAVTTVQGIAEGPLFDGIRLFIKNDNTKLNQSLSCWSDSLIFDFRFGRAVFLDVLGYEEPASYRIDFGDVGIDTSESGYISYLYLESKAVNFRITNILTGEPVSFLFGEIDGEDGKFTVNQDDSDETDIIFLLTKDEKDSLIATWEVKLSPDYGDRNPQKGDTLYLNLFRAFQDGDQYRFSNDILGFDPASGKMIDNYRLFQNYPNPFNPVTNIRFRLPEPRNVVISIYDINGRKVRTLVNKKISSGDHLIQWDGHNSSGKSVASGVYFYRLETANFVKTKKMLLLR